MFVESRITLAHEPRPVNKNAWFSHIFWVKTTAPSLFLLCVSTADKPKENWCWSKMRQNPVIGFVFSTSFSQHAELRTNKLALNWLCFRAALAHQNRHKLLLLLMLRKFVGQKIGFVFSTSFSQHAELRTNKLALFGFVFLCPNKRYFTIISFQIRLYADYAPVQIGFVFSD